MDLWGSGLSSWASDQRAPALLKPFVKTPKDLGSNPSRSAHEVLRAISLLLLGFDIKLAG